MRFSAEYAKREDYEILKKLQMKAEEYHADYISMGDARDQEFAHNPSNSAAAARLCKSFWWLCAFITARKAII